MKKFATLFAALATAGACTAVAHTDPAPNPVSHLAASAAAECRIAVTPTPNGLRFDALARSHDYAAGQYEFVLTKIDRGGSSDIQQGGEFRLNAGAQDVLGSSELSLDRGGRYRARLVLWDSNGEICRVQRRS
jgi:hypothetical protein